MNTNDSGGLDEKHARNDAERRRQIRQWAEYVRTHPDGEWGRQVNKLVNAQLQSARHRRNGGEKETEDETRSGQ
jgi:hypothetical protein